MLPLSHIFNYAMMSSTPQHSVAILPIFMSIVFYHYKQLVKIMEDLDRKDRLAGVKCSICGKKSDFEGTPVNPLTCGACLMIEK